MEFHCRLITPGFLRGANHQVAELRAPSVRGALRWWFRAMQSENNISDLRVRETAHFGNASEASPIALRCVPTSKEEVFREVDLRRVYKLEGGFDPENKRHKGRARGIKYLLNRALSGQAFLRDGFSFKISLLGADQAAKQSYAKALWLLLFLGGLGLRSRRGFGNLICTGAGDFSQSGLPDLVFRGQTSSALHEHLRAGLSKLAGPRKTEKYSSLKGAKVQILKRTFTSWQDALEEIGSKYEEYRFELRKAGKIFDGPNFGLPVIHSKGWKVVASDCSRRSSPLIFKTWSNYEGTKFWSGFIHLNGILTPDGKLVRDDKPGQTQGISTQVVENFLGLFESDTLTVTI